MKVRRIVISRWFFLLVACLLCAAATERSYAAKGPAAQEGGTKTRLAVVGLDHDHVWELLKYMAAEQDAELVAIADGHPALVERAKKQVPASVKFYTDYVQMLDEAKPDAVFVTTENDRHLEILRECAKRHINYSVEKPMAVNAADAKEMERLADQAGIKLMVNYWNAWVAPSRELFHRVKNGDVGPIHKMIIEYGHEGPKEIGVSQYFADWLYDPVKNGGGAIVDFGCYGAEWAVWLKGRPTRVYATSRKLKTEQHNRVDDDDTIVLDYPDATAIVEASWDWPYNMDRIQVFGAKGSLSAGHDNLFYRNGRRQAIGDGPDGAAVKLDSLPHEGSNPVAYLVSRIREHKPVEDPVSARLNVQVVEILSAARESIATGQPQELH
jgi:predicted dehydrogenase